MNAVMTIEEIECECRGLRVIEHPLLGTIRCPRCTTRELPRDPRAFRRLAAIDAEYRLNGAEARRVKRAQARIVALALGADKLKLTRMDPEFVSTDRVLQRWGMGQGTGLPASNPDVYRTARPPPLDDKTQERVSDIVRHSPPWVSAFADDWYASHIPVEVIRSGPYFSALGEPRTGRHLSERGIYREWHAILRYLRFRFERSGHSDLVVLVRALP